MRVTSLLNSGADVDGVMNEVCLCCELIGPNVIGQVE